MKHRLLKPYLETFFRYWIKSTNRKTNKVNFLHCVSYLSYFNYSKKKFSHYGVISNGMSDHDFIYCTRKTKTVKTNLKNDLKEPLLERLRKKYFRLFQFQNAAYTNLTLALQEIVNELAPMKDFRIKGNTKPWFDSDIMESIRLRQVKVKIFKKKISC